MEYYTTIEELINSADDSEISYRNLHNNIYIKNKDTIIKIPYKSVVNEYLNFYKKTVITTKFGELEAVKYRYKPKMLSYDLYGTTELWSSLLELNNMISTVEFTLEGIIKVFEPKEFKKLLNETMILEDILT